MWPERDADHTLPSSAEVKKELGYTSTHPMGPPGPVTGFPLSTSLFLFWEFVSCYSVKFTSTFTFTFTLPHLNPNGRDCHHDQIHDKVFTMNAGISFSGEEVTLTRNLTLFPCRF
jgi:hypothetical protein